MVSRAAATEPAVSKQAAANSAPSDAARKVLFGMATEQVRQQRFVTHQPRVALLWHTDYRHPPMAAWQLHGSWRCINHLTRVCRISN